MMPTTLILEVASLLFVKCRYSKKYFMVYELTLTHMPAAAGVICYGSMHKRCVWNFRECLNLFTMF